MQENDHYLNASDLLDLCVEAKSIIRLTDYFSQIGLISWLGLRNSLYVPICRAATFSEPDIILSHPTFNSIGPVRDAPGVDGQLIFSI